MDPRSNVGLQVRQNFTINPVTEYSSVKHPMVNGNGLDDDVIWTQSIHIKAMKLRKGEQNQESLRFFTVLRVMTCDQDKKVLCHQDRQPLKVDEECSSTMQNNTELKFIVVVTSIKTSSTCLQLFLKHLHSKNIFSTFNVSNYSRSQKRQKGWHLAFI